MRINIKFYNEVITWVYWHPLRYYLCSVCQLIKTLVSTDYDDDRHITYYNQNLLVIKTQTNSWIMFEVQLMYYMYNTKIMKPFLEISPDLFVYGFFQKILHGGVGKHYNWNKLYGGIFKKQLKLLSTVKTKFNRCGNKWRYLEIFIFLLNLSTGYLYCMNYSTNILFQWNITV